MLLIPACVVVRRTTVLSEEDFDTIESWLDEIKKKIKRSVQAGQAEAPN